MAAFVFLQVYSSRCILWGFDWVGSAKMEGVGAKSDVKALCR